MPKDIFPQPTPQLRVSAARGLRPMFTMFSRPSARASSAMVRYRKRPSS